MRQLRRIATALLASAVAVAMTALAGCASPGYTYASDTSDHAYFKVPAGWQQVSPVAVRDAQLTQLSQSAAGPAGGAFAWSRAYAGTAHLPITALFAGSRTPVVYASVQDIGSALRAALSYDFMRDLLLPVTPQARQAAAAAGQQLTGFSLVASSIVTGSGGVRGINELFEYDFGGQPDAFDQTVLTNSSTTKLYLLLVQCYQSCFVAHENQIKTVVESFTVRGP
jgi:hypothetical protein